MPKDGVQYHVILASACRLASSESATKLAGESEHHSCGQASERSAEGCTLLDACRETELYMYRSSHVRCSFHMQSK